MQILRLPGDPGDKLTGRPPAPESGKTQNHWQVEVHT